VKRLFVTVDIERAYQKLISHSLARWLWLYPSLPRMLQMYLASSSHFMPSTSQLLFWNVFLQIRW